MKLVNRRTLLLATTPYLSFAYQFPLDLNLDFCPPHSMRSPFDLSCLPSASSPELQLAQDLLHAVDRPQEITNSIHSKEQIPTTSIWGHKPRCLRQQNATDRYCIYTSNDFARGRGISLFMNSNSAGELLDLPAFMDEDALDGVNEEHNPPYISQQIPGKGMGLVATRPIKRGEHIFSTTPVFILEEEVYELFRAKDRYPFYHLAIKQLPPASEKLFNDLMGHFGGDPVEDIVNTNCFAIEMFADTRDGEHVSMTAVFPEVSRMNHDCRPNAHYYFDPRTLTQHVHALRTIIPGEELTISYIDPVQTRAERLDALHTSWGFPCNCKSCTATHPIAEASDTRIHTILNITGILRSTKAENEKATPALADVLVDLYELEGLHGPICEAYTLAALEASGWGRKEDALRFAFRAVEAGLLYSGPRDEDVKSMQTLLRGVEDHWSWKIRERRRVKAQRTREAEDEDVLVVE